MGKTHRIALFGVAVAMATSCGSVKDHKGGDFTLSVTSSAVAIPIASANMVTIAINRTGDVGDVMLEAQGLPSGITASFDANPVPSSGASATVTFAVAPGTAAGTSTVTIVGTAGDLERSVTLMVTAQTITVSGTVRGGAQGVMVRMPGKPAVMSGPGGAFSFTDVSPPYDLYTFSSPLGSPAVTYYKGLTRPDPIINVATLQLLVLPISSTGTVTGTKSGGDTTTPMLIVWDSDGSGAVRDVAPSSYTLNPRWPKATTRAGVLYGFQFTKRPTGAPSTFPGFGSSGQVTLSENVTQTVNINMSAPQTAVLTGSITSPAGFSTPTITLNQQLGSGFVTLWTSTTTTTADATIPVIAAGKSTVYATAALNGAVTQFVDPGLSAAKDITFALPAPAVQLAPVDIATGVNTTTPFNWTGTPMTVYELNITSTTTQGSAKARYIVYTTDPMATIPVVPELPVPSNQSFQWEVNGYGPNLSINDAASMTGLETVSSLDFDGGRHSFTNSTTRTFTSAP